LRHLTIFSNRFLLTNQGKLLSKLCIPCIFDKSLPWLGIEFYALKISMSFYLFVAILCAKMYSVYRPLNWRLWIKWFCQSGKTRNTRKVIKRRTLILTQNYPTIFSPATRTKKQNKLISYCGLSFAMIWNKKNFVIFHNKAISQTFF